MAVLELGALCQMVAYEFLNRTVRYVRGIIGMMKKQKLLLFVIGVLMVIGLIMERKLVKHIFFPCRGLLPVAEVERVVKEHQDMVDKIKRVRPEGYVRFTIDDYGYRDKCPGKAGILITFPAEKDRIKIKQIINSETFFGVSYHLVNI